MPTKRFAAALLAIAASTLSCSVLIDTKDSQCSVDADCEALGEACSDGTSFYFSAMVPDKTLSETTAQGAAGFVNVPLGNATLSGIYEGRDMSPNVVVSKKGWFSYAEVFP